MYIWSAWKLWNKPAGRPAAEKNIRAAESENLLNRALSGLRDERAQVPSWNAMERLILTGKKEQSMAISRASVFAFSRQAALIAAACVVVVLAFFTVPFSQTGELGSNIIFEFDPPLADPQGYCERFENAGAVIGIEGFGENDGCRIAIKVGEEGMESLEVTVLSESGLTPDEIIAKLKSQYPELEQAEVAINPITERSSCTMFGKILGDANVSLECEGKTAEEIKAEIEAILQSNGVADPEVQVIKSDTDGKTTIKICAPAGGCGK